MFTRQATILIPKPKNYTELKVKNGGTHDIINEILSTFKYSKHETQRFAPVLKADNINDTLKNVYWFVERQPSPTPETKVATPTDSLSWR